MQVGVNRDQLNVRMLIAENAAQITVLAGAEMENTLCPPEAHPLVGSQTSAHRTGVHPTVLGIVLHGGAVADIELLCPVLP